VTLLEQEEPPCVLPTDIYESMEVTIAGTTVENATTFCDLEPIVAARAQLNELVERYLPATSAFERFRLHKSFGPCPMDTDCSGYVELHADGRLRVDEVDDVSYEVIEVTLAAADLNAAIAVLTAPELVTLLEQEEPPCVLPTDIHESMELVRDGVTIENSTTFCDLEPIAAARDLLNQLAADAATE